MTPSRPLAAVAILCASLIAPAFAQSQDKTPPLTRSQQAEQFEANRTTRVFHLVNVGQANEANEILVAIRNVVNPMVKLYLLQTTNDVVVSAPPEDIAQIGKLIAELDHPKHAYRLTYTIAESDSGKRVGIQHFSVVVLLGQRVQLKQGDKIPVVTGSFSTEKSSSETQFTYLDIGMNLDSTIDAFAGGLRLRSKVEQSSVSPVHQTIANVEEPIVRQSVIEGTSVITPGKPLTLGGIDIAGSTRHIDIEVVADPLS